MNDNALIQEEPLVELSHVFLNFDNLQVLQDVSIKIYRGEFVVLHGSTGCGKSTVLRLISGLLLPTAGAIRVAGEDIQDFSNLQRRWLRRAIGLMMQNSPLLEDRTILENVMLPALAAEATIDEARQRAVSALARCHMSEWAQAKPVDLSSGQRQQVCLARAVVNQPVLILADEPAAHLDAANAQNLINLLGEFANAGVTVIVASHLLLAPQDVDYREIKFAAPQGV
ncbi:MAG: ATP-binding cassette domain-containing protein [Burkholderiaceae bacterium]|nr:ATP-binding cassette domain-containing protein [Burkholderiaceae bacterium]